jgi:hypothetical protein
VESHSSLSTIPSPPVLWRVVYAPAPWNWTDWADADHGRFNGRWDSPDGSYRLYAGTTLRACLVEVLAPFRPSPAVALGLDAIEEDEADRVLHPTADAGLIPRELVRSTTCRNGRSRRSLLRRHKLPNYRSALADIPQAEP